MTRRTYNIIMACKKNEKANCIESVREYMSKECMCPIEYYGEIEMGNIMRDAMYDYIDTCDKPSSFLREMDSIFGYASLSKAELIARTFRLVRVRNDNGYVNGFEEWEESWEDDQ